MIERPVARDPALTKEQQKKKKKPKETNSVITSLAAASRTYTAEYLFAVNGRREAAMNSHTVGLGGTASAAAALAEQRLVYRRHRGPGMIGPLTKGGQEIHNFWQLQRRQHLARHPHILSDIITALRDDPSMSWNAVSGQIGNWCSGDAIRRFFAAHDSSTYLERILPLMTPGHKKAAVKFGNRLNNKWGLGKKEKVIYVTADEKWFLGITPQHGKLCERLGLTKSHLYAQHKDHVPKVLAIAFTAYAFEGSMENGGKGLKIGCYRCQSAKIAGKAQNKSVKGKDGKVTYPGPDQGGERLRERGQAYMVDCAITGSDEGTSSDPKFALLPLLRDSVFGDILALTAAGAQFEGYRVVFQWDNAGPHCEEGLMTWVNAFCAQHGWRWEPQAAQLPVSNPQDLYVFPLMAKLHAHKMKALGHAPRSADAIWKGVMKVWKEMPSANVAAAHLHAKRIMAKIVAHEGDTRFLNEGGKGCNIRRDFEYTNTGIVPRSS